MLLAAVLGCASPPEPTDGGTPDPTTSTACDPAECDVDADGSVAVAFGGTDCDDNNADVHVRGHEICNAIDDDCDALIDDADPGLDLRTAAHWWTDTDHDAYGGGTPVARCVAPPDSIDEGTDCDDTNVAVNPAANEVCNGYDDDCDGLVDDDDPTRDPATATTYWDDSDGDGFGDPAIAIIACSAPDNAVTNDDDCDPLDSTRFTATLWWLDADKDGFGSVVDVPVLSCTPVPGHVEVGGDCDDEDKKQYPGAIWYRDADADTFGDPAFWVVQCPIPLGYVIDATDCDDTDPRRAPNAVWFADLDGDGFGDDDAPVAGCPDLGDSADDATDCDDADAAVFPGAIEICNFVDDDCDKKADEGFPDLTWFEDLDGDGFGDASVSVDQCAAPAGFVEPSGDCDVSDDTVYPGAPEACGDVDRDCDGEQTPLTFGPAALVKTVLHTTSGAPSDIDSDGDVDVVWTDATDVQWSENLGGPGTFVNSLLIDDTFTSPLGVRLADLDGDTDDDVVWVSSSVDDVIVWAENRGGGTFGPGQIVGDHVDGPLPPAIVDVDDDGDLDVVTGASDGTGVVWFANLGDGSFEAALPVADLLDTPAALVALDGDGDGDPDVVAAPSEGDELVWIENLGSGLFGAPETVALATAEITSLLASDADGDGDPDLVACASGDATVKWLENLGGGAFGAPALVIDLGAGPATVSAHAADLDGDGDDDLVALSSVSPTVVWAEQLGGGVFAPMRGVAERLHSVWVDAADIDGDGQTDVIAASSSAAPARIDWYEADACE